MKIWHISDTHSYHNLLEIPPEIDIICHTGDFSNWRDISKNQKETLDFIEWFSKLDIKYKILVAGNHDSYAFNKSKEFKKLCKDSGIIYLEHESIIIEGIKFYGTPITPNFNNWFFMTDRSKTHKHWEKIDIDTNVLLLHGPPKGILDLSHNRDNELEQCGDTSLMNIINSKIFKNLKLVLFGHIHNSANIINQRILYDTSTDISFSNGSVMKDGKFGVLTSKGHIFEF